MTACAPTTPSEIATARSLMAEMRQELGLLVGAGAVGLAPSFASAVANEVQLGGAPAGCSTFEVTEQNGQLFVAISGRAGVVLTMAEGLRLATQISEILNRRKG